MTEEMEPNIEGARIFVVEDESVITMLLQDMFEELNCEVVSLASRFQDALDKANTLSFEVAILDVNLNGQRTFPIAEALRARGLPFIFATGYGAAAVPENFRAAPVLQKPFRIADLERAVRTALATPRAA
ncbi:MAG TPA: response regulator [Stellaceae bacterium]|jgi:CheY-like chemotaxis protein